MKNNDLKKLWRYYWEPTPVNVRKFFDSVLVACTVIGETLSVNGFVHAGMIFNIIGVSFKIISNFLTRHK